jgi:hypothetical protein
MDDVIRELIRLLPLVIIFFFCVPVIALSAESRDIWKVTADIHKGTGKGVDSFLKALEISFSRHPKVQRQRCTSDLLTFLLTAE